MLTKAQLWKWFYSTWQPSPLNPKPGFTLLLPVPGDLPVFLKIALEVCNAQNNGHLIETLVIPDNTTHRFAELFQAWSSSYQASPLKLIRFQPVEQWVAKQQNNPGTNHWLQLVRGVEAAQTTHALLHDADLFITNRDFMKTHYELCTQENLACLGVSPVWDKWYQSQGINHLAATWEMMFEIGWLRSFQPWQHRGHDNYLFGEKHTFDTTLWPQCHTSPEKIGQHQENLGFVHFNYVISTYRWFQRSQGRFEDVNCRILLIRLLIDAYDRSDWPYGVPSLDELVKGLSNPDSRVTYTKPETRQKYREFRSKFQALLDSDLLRDDQLEILSNGIQPFDRAFEFSPSKRLTPV